MKLSELAHYATESTGATLANTLSRMIIEVKPIVAHCIGAMSGFTGLAAATGMSDWIEDMEQWLGLGIVLMAFVGGFFYMVYWFIKMRLIMKSNQDVDLDE